MSPKKIAIIISVLIVVVGGGAFGAMKYQQHQQYLEEQRQEQIFKGFCHNDVLPILNASSALESEHIKLTQGAKNRDFNHLFDELKSMREKNSDLKQKFAQSKVENKKSSEMYGLVNQLLSAYDDETSNCVYFFEQQRTFQVNEHYNRQKANEAAAERDKAGKKLVEAQNKYMETQKKIIEIAGFHTGTPDKPDDETQNKKQES